MSDDPFHLDRFVEAQEPIYEQALAELRDGAKRSHWMWFIFPQLIGIGRSSMATHYGIRSIEEARAYLAHPLLGARLRDCVKALVGLPTSDPASVLGAIDAMKLRSSLTLFERAGGPAFGQLLDQWFDGERDPATLALLARLPGQG